MQSSNPVLTRAEGFNGQRTSSASGMSYPSYGAPQQGYRTDERGRPEAGYGGGPGGGTGVPTRSSSGPMTIDSVVQKSGITLGIVALVAAVTWVLTPAMTDAGAAATLYSLSLVGALAGFALAMVNSFKKVVSPALVIAYAAVEGIFVGAFSKVIDSTFGRGEHGIVVGAVVGTFAAVAGTLAAYKFFNIRVSPTFRKWVVGAIFGFVALSLLDLVLGLFHSSFGFNGFGGLGLVTSVIGLGLGVLMLILDFDFVERGIAAGLPERESWRAAFGLTVTIIWIYIELLRILAILRGD